MNNEDKVKIVLADDHAIVLDGVASLLAATPKISVVGKAASGQQTLDLLNRVDAHIVIMDYSMEGMDAMTLISSLKKFHPGVKIIVMTMHDEPTIVQDVLRAGVAGYVLKKYTHHELLTAIDVIMGGGQFWSQDINKILLNKLQPHDMVQITDREAEVLRLLVNGQTSKQIAAQLFISERTVETHRKNMLRKTNTTNIAGLLRYAHTHNLV